MGRASPRLGGGQREPGQAFGLGGRQAEQAEAGLGELVDRALFAFGLPLVEAQQPDEATRHGAESDLGVSHAELTRSTPGLDVPQGARRQAARCVEEVEAGAGDEPRPLRDGSS